MATVEVNSAKMNCFDASRRYRITPRSLVVFFSCLLITVFLFIAINNSDRDRTLDGFENVTKTLVSALHKELSEFNDSIFAIQAFIDHQHDAADPSHGLGQFVNQLLGDEIHVRAVAWVMPGPALNQDVCHTQVAPAPNQAFGLCELIAFDRGETLLAKGLDNNPALLAALSQSLKTGADMIVSGAELDAQGMTAEQRQHRFFVFQITHDHRTDQLHSNEVIHAGEPGNADSLFRGFLVIEDYIPDLVEQGLKLYTEGGAGADIYLLETITDGSSQLLHYHPSRLRNNITETSALKLPDTNALLVSTTSFNVGGKNWQLIFEGIPAAFRLTPETGSIALLIIGTLLSFLWAAFLTVIADKKLFAEQEVDNRTLQLTQANKLLEEEARNSQRIAEEMERNLQVRDTFNAVLDVAIRKVSLVERLEMILGLVLDAEWLSIETAGSIFLVDEGHETLTLTVQRGLAEPLLDYCANIAFGQCLCGKAAATQELVFAGCLDHEHTITFEGIEPHGHYCVPIMSEQVTLGVLNVYVEHDHQSTEFERHNLNMIGSILSGIIERDNIEKLVKKTLKDLDNQVNALNEHAIVSVLDKQLRITSINYKYSKLSGFSEEELIGGHCCIGLSDDQPEEFYINMENIISSGKSWKGEMCSRNKDNQPYWTKTTIVPFKIENEIYKYVVISTDITEQKLAEKRLQSKHTEIRKAHRELNFQKMALDEHAIVSISDAEGNITYANDKFCELSQYSLEELIGKNHRLLKSGNHPDEFFEAMWDSISNGHVWKGDICNRKKNGSWYWVAATIVPFLDDSGKPHKYIAIRVDITAQKENEQKLIARNKEIEQAHQDLESSQNMMLHSEKLASVGQLAAGIAHEINTPIQFVGDNTRFLQESFKDLIQLVAVYEEIGNAANKGNVPAELINKARTLSEEVELDYLAEEVPSAISQSLEGVERISKIVRSMKDFSHPGSDSLECIDLNNAIDSTINVSRNEWKYVAEMVTEFDPALTAVPCYPGELNQVILNMIVNAAHAIQNCRNENDPLGTITISTRLDENDVEIRISDSGCGMAEDISKHIFEPFFTTKGVGKGTGQGLAIAYAVIVEKHKGRVSVESETGKGTTFIIRLPMHEESNNPVTNEIEEIMKKSGAM